MDRITTGTLNWVSTKDLAEKSVEYFQKRGAEFLAQFCEVCGELKENCRCEEIAARKAYEEKMRPIWEAQAERKRIELLKQSESKRLGGLRAYEDFTAKEYTNKAVLDALKNFPQENYYLWGKAGAGKTHAAVAVLREQKDGYVVRMGQVSREVRSCETPEEEDEIISKYANGIFLFDDLGSEKATEFLQNILFEIMDRRWQNKRGGLIITSNMSIEKLGEIIGDRTASRIAGLVGANNALELDGKDYRLGGK